MTNDKPTSAAAIDPPGYRSGVAARLAGLGAATLRVWERRYQLTEAPRSVTGQRLYTPEQVRRLALLKQLVDQGHPIGTLAALPPERLLALAGAAPAADGAGAAGAAGAAHAAPSADAGVIEVAAYGAGLLRRLSAAIDDGLPLRLRALDDKQGPLTVATAPASLAPLVLLVELPEPGAGALAWLTGARHRSGATAVVVLYRFCSSATVRSLRDAGFMVARFPGEMGELPLLCKAALQRCQGAAPVLASPAMAPLPPAHAIAARFDDLTLASICAASGDGADDRRDSARALAGMLLHMASFERYSASCAVPGPGVSTLDAALHRDLETVAMQARLLLEQAMGRLLRAGE